MLKLKLTKLKTIKRESIILFLLACITMFLITQIVRVLISIHATQKVIESLGELP